MLCWGKMPVSCLLRCAAVCHAGAAVTAEAFIGQAELEGPARAVPEVAVMHSSLNVVVLLLNMWEEALSSWCLFHLSFRHLCTRLTNPS